ncbi:helix-turn-helix domain-containing protein [Vagococcus elongatus]|uniref:HTH cro/C1-type domain-containing protein n=1 Tax=Vagococcus elongatus TaxID=180344 RepID=A0A430B5K5_9ENTE|nr:helix-turn-helix domain-containing protein [Vagococcus elongatus]RSU15598.1 hypothetical protein CBF29_00550 [Vagococcus elongatus]
MNIGKKIKEERQKKGWTQEHFADLINVSRSTVSSWEVGRNIPDIETILLISDLYGISLDKLLREEKNILKKTIGRKVTVRKAANHFEAIGETENSRYYMKETTSLPTQRKYVIEDAHHQKIGLAKRKRYNFGMYDLPRLFLKIDNWNEISIIKDMIQFRRVYNIKGEEITIEGDFLGNQFTILRKGEKISDVSVSQEEDISFDVTILDELLEPLMISFIFLVALVYEEEKNVIQLKK